MKDLHSVLSIIWNNSPGSKATHYKIMYYIPSDQKYSNTEEPKGIPTLILFWHKEDSATPFAYEHNLDQATNFIRGWLSQLNYGSQPDHDGDNDRGWRVFNESWNHINRYSYSFAGIQPAWAMYGK